MKGSTIRSTRLALLLPLLGFAAAAAGAEEGNTPKPAPKDPWRDFELSLGYFVADLNSDIQAGTTNVALDINLEDILGMDPTTQTFWLEATVRLGDRHRLTFDYFDLSRTASASLGRDIEFNGKVYSVGTDVSSSFRLQFYNLVYGYSILQDDRMDVAVTFGIHGLNTRVGLSADSVGNEHQAFFLPVPLPGLRGQFALTPDLFFKQDLEFLYLKFGNYEGLLVDVKLALEYALFDHVGLGVGYEMMKFELDMKSDSFPAVDFAGQFKFGYSGVMLYTTVFF